MQRKKEIEYIYLMEKSLPFFVIPSFQQSSDQTKDILVGLKFYYIQSAKKF